ncbi:TPA: hypothetical protein HA231_01575 [Candidatus Woesearchaeota archaeon]|nr:hypothetical protein [Candidatus Woesearchaeota archaeon]
MDWTACRKNKDLVKEVKPDKNLTASLIKSSAKKLYSESLLELNDDTASSKISLAYDALRELLEASALSRGFKIYNHECYCSFLKEVVNESSLGDEFNEFRKIRNAINYYGKDVTAEEAKLTLEEMKLLIKRVKEQLL